MARCDDCIHKIVCSALIKDGLPWNDGEYPAEAFCFDFQPTANVAPRAEVAREIFEEIDKLLSVDESGFWTLAECGLEEGFSYCETYVHNLRNKLAELRKKYESEGENNG